MDVCDEEDNHSSDHPVVIQSSFKMKSFFLLSAVLPSLVSVASAVSSVAKPPVGSSQSTSTIEATCVTLLGSISKSKVGTAYHTQIIHSTAHLTSTSTPSTTVYPSTQDTTTSTMVCMETSTVVANVSTDYYTSYSTNYQTSTFTSSVNTTTTLIIPSTVYTTQTITVPTSAGFVPVASGMGYPGAKKREAHPNNRFDLDARAVSSSLSKSASTTLAVIQAQSGVPMVSGSYPTTVSCETIFEIFTTLQTTVTGTSTATITAPPFTATVYVMNNITSTSTLIPEDARVSTIFIDEIAVSTTIVETETFTSTVSNIVTVAAPSATYYAACAPNNIVGTANGASFGAMQISGTVQPRFYYAHLNSAYDCCVACQTTNNCAGASYVDGTCSVYPIGGTAGTSGGTCNPKVFFGDYFPYSGGDPQTVINGPCGQFAYGMGGCYRDNGGFC